MEIKCNQFGQGKPIVLLHGWQHEKNSFNPLVPFLFKKYHLYLIDLPGFGESPFDEQLKTSSDYANRITNWLETKKIHSAVIVGHSFGGKIASLIAYQNPKYVNHLILIAPSGIPQPKAYYPILKIIPQGIKNILKIWSDKYLTSNDYRQAGKLLPLLKNIVKEDLRSIYPNINIPTLIIWGQSDKELPVKQAKIINQLIPNSKLMIISGDHSLHWQNPQKLAEIINQFINNE